MMKNRVIDQIARKHFDPTTTFAPVTNNTTIRTILVLMLLSDWMARTNNIKGAFLKGKFENGKKFLCKCQAT